VGRNPQSAGAAVKVEDVPCDFLFVGACNIKDVQGILSPLRSRILGNGYEILLDTVMPETSENLVKLRQFIAQEINMDGRIPHADMEAVEEVIEEARRRAKEIDNVRDSLTLRLRGLSGLIKMAGDFAVLGGCNTIRKKHILKSINEAKPIEHKVKDRYGSMWNAESQEGVVKPDAGTMDGYV
jgi:lon-related putative ATP-dependent protease